MLSDDMPYMSTQRYFRKAFGAKIDVSLATRRTPFGRPVVPEE